jgi:uncharacterized repeat protein (TIGR01451 family)
MNCVGNGRGISRWVILCRPFSVPAALLTLCALVAVPASAEPAPAAAPCLPGPGFTDCLVFGYTGADQRFVVPEGVTSLSAQLWGAGGGTVSGDGTGRRAGGAGGFTAGAVSVSGGELMTITVGAGGASDGMPGYGGGGAGGTSAHGVTGGSGGGMSALWEGPSGSTPLLVAGGGGGAGTGSGSVRGNETGAGANGDLATAISGGAGGGVDGGTSGLPGSGLGATQIAGGSAGSGTISADAYGPGCPSRPTAGTKFQGGNGASATGSAAVQSGGGGGGGGYYGGGGGTCQADDGAEPAGSGGGGSGFAGGPGVSGVSVSGSPDLPAHSAATSLPPGTADGASADDASADGGNGEVVIEWARHVELSVAQSVAPSPFVPGRPITYTFTVRNGGPARAASVRITDQLPAGLWQVSWRCSSLGAGSRCQHRSGFGGVRTRADIAAGGEVAYTITGITAADAPDLSASATVRPPRHTFDGGCEPSCHATATALARPRFALRVVRALSPGALVPGTRVKYALTVRNGGPSDAFGARVDGPVPGRLRSVTWTCRSTVAPSRCLGASGAGDIETTADIAAGGSVTYTVTGMVPDDRARAADRARAPAAGPPEPGPLRRVGERGCARECDPRAAALPAAAQPVPGDYYLLDLAAVLWTLIIGALVLLIRSTRLKAAARRR